MHRLIVTSATYKQVSLKDGHDVAWSFRLQTDPGKDLWSRQIRRRLTGEMLRDTMLAVSGSLNKRKGGPGVRPPLPTEITSRDNATSTKVKPRTALRCPARPL